MDTVVPTADRALYEADEHAWIARQIEALRSGQLHRLDRDTLVEYLTEMTIRDRRELKSRLRVLLQHLLKITMQPERLSRSWVRTVQHQQDEIRDIMEFVPTLAAAAETLMRDAYPAAVREAAAETGIQASAFPSHSPWSVQAALAFVPPAPPQPVQWKRSSRGSWK